MLKNFSLRQWLTIPYVVLVLALVLVIGSLSYREGSRAVDTMSDRLLLETVRHVNASLEQHLNSSTAVLEAAFPAGIPTTERIEDDWANLRRRLWAATSLNLNPNNSIYFANELGQSIGVFRSNAEKGELRVRHSVESPRVAYTLDGVDRQSQDGRPISKAMDSRQRPWYAAASKSDTAIWTSIYADFNTGNLGITRAKKVLTESGAMRGVVATDIHLTRVNDFIQSIKVSPNSVAFVLDEAGQLVASSRTLNAAKLADSTWTRLNVSEAGNALQAQAYVAMQGQISGPPQHAVWTSKFQTEDEGLAYLAVTRISESTGLNWWVAVAVPRSDFMGDIGSSAIQTAVIGALAALAALLIGFSILHRVSDDLHQLTHAVQRFGVGQRLGQLTVKSRGEIGRLAKAFGEMQTRLATDTLTGLHNRESILRALQDRIAQAMQHTDLKAFAILFVDLDHFKLVNDRLGHHAGDQVLMEMAERLRSAVHADDIVARYGGDEFLVLLHDVSSLAAAEQVRAQLETTLAAQLDCIGLGEIGDICTGGTVGLACSWDGIATANELIERADQDMYRRKIAKNTGKARAVIHHEEFETAA